MKEEPLTIDVAIRQVIDQLDGPTPLGEVVQRVLAICPSKAKNPSQQIRNRVRPLYWPDWVWLDERTLLPMRLAVRGVRFRIVPSQSELERNLFYAMPALHGFHPRNLPWNQVQLVDAAGQTLPFEPVTFEERRPSPYGEIRATSIGFQSKAWLAQKGFRAGDSILATVIDWDAGRFQIEYEPASQRRNDEIARKNQEMADLLYGVLEEASSEVVHAITAVPTAYARMAEPGGYPGDHWVEVIRNDLRMVWMEPDIRYADFLSPVEAELFDKPYPPVPSFTPQQGRQVYRFRAELAHRPALWRQIDILGEQSLAEFDYELRRAFEHDTFDHMSGFWKKVQRGQTKRFRQIDLGHLNPLGEGEAADVQVAGLGLQPGERLKYVYDFGDWIEHTLTLEEILEPEPGADYPRVAARNKPRYQYCERCKERGDKTVALYMCIDCSNRHQSAVLLCERCAEEEHEDHYVDDMLY